MRKLLIVLLVLFAPLLHAELRVAATTPNMGMLAQAVGGEHVRVRVMAPGDRDIHYLEARPSMMAALRRADLVVAVGAELEVGWLPAALEGAQNRRVMPGQSGYFEGAAFIDLIDKGQPADRARGDVHPVGNPHYYLDPLRMAEVGHALAARLGELDGDNAERYRENAERLAAEVEQRLPGWREGVADAPGVVPYHSDVDYLMRLLDVEILGYIESVPGVPPTGRHLRELVSDLRNHDRGTIVYQVFHPDQGPRFIAGELNWPVHQLRSEVQPGDRADEYFAMIGRWIDALEQ